LQEYILSHSSDAVPYITLISYEEDFERFIEFLNKTFENNKSSLKEFIMRKIEPTDLNIFHLLRDYDGWYENVQ